MSIGSIISAIRRCLLRLFRAGKTEEPLNPVGSPTSPPADAGPSAPSVGSYPFRVARIWSGPTETYKLVGMLDTAQGLIVTTSNVYRGRNHSRVFLEGREIYAGSEETIGQPFAVGDTCHFPVEHGSNVLYLYDGQILKGARTRGRWSVAGGVFQQTPLVAYNNAYQTRRFSDSPILVNSASNKVFATLPVSAMPRCIVEYGKEQAISHNFGTNGVTIGRPGVWRTIGANIVQIAVHRGALYGGESAAWGPHASAGTAGGKIVKLRAGDERFDTLFDTGCSCITHMAVLQGRLWIAGIDPDRLYVMDARERFSLVADLPGETSSNEARSFGGAVAEQNGKILWGRSARSRAHVYEIT